jgi:hypothetical protein
MIRANLRGFGNGFFSPCCFSGAPSSDCEYFDTLARRPTTACSRRARSRTRLMPDVRQTRVILRIEAVVVLALVTIGCASTRVLQDSDRNSYAVKVMSDGRTWTTSGRSSGFNAVLGGNRDPGGSYARLDAQGFYWTATESDNEHAWFYNFGSLGLNRHQGGDKSMAVSVRCIEGR